MIIGAGVGGLVAALRLAVRGLQVTVVEAATSPGGKMRELLVDGARIDAGPTVFTMRWVFDAIFAEIGATLSERLTLRPVDTLARHAWSRSERLDLFADIDRSAEAIRGFAGPREADGYVKFCRRAGAVYATLREPFIASSRPSPVDLVRRAGLAGLGDLARISPFTTLWRALGDGLQRRFRRPAHAKNCNRWRVAQKRGLFHRSAQLLDDVTAEQAGRAGDQA